MRTFFECLPCFINQALGSLRNCNATDEQIKDVMHSVLAELSGMDFNVPPPVTAQKIYRIISKTPGLGDPYASKKQQYNRFARELLAGIQKRTATEQDVFSSKVILAIAANIIDFGKNSELSESDVLRSFEKAVGVSIDSVALRNLRQELQEAESVLFLCDNAGEIVFDRFLIEEMPCHKVISAVRGAPVINDATLEDAQAVGLTEMVKVIQNGSDAPGTILKDCSPEFNTVFNQADVIISKGQGNFETLSDITNKRIFFLFQVKCPVIARNSGYPVGTFVLKDNQSAEECTIQTKMEMKNE